MILFLSIEGLKLEEKGRCWLKYAPSEWINMLCPSNIASVLGFILWFSCNTTYIFVWVFTYLKIQITRLVSNLQCENRSWITIKKSPEKAIPEPHIPHFIYRYSRKLSKIATSCSSSSPTFVSFTFFRSSSLSTKRFTVKTSVPVLRTSALELKCLWATSCMP